MQQTRRIHTLTANLLWETTYSVDFWKPGETVRAADESVQVGGKGINVNRMLKRLGAANTAIVFPAGAVGAQCASWLTKHRISYRSFETSGETRTGFVVRTPGTPETTFLGADRSIEAKAVRACCDYLETLPKGDVLAVCGSIPGWTSAAFDPLRETLEALFSELFIAADTYGPPLAWFAEKPAGLIKINQREFRELGGRDGIASSDPSLNAFSPRAWIVTDGKRKVKGVDSVDGYWEKDPPAVEEVSPTGSGDVMFATLLHSHLNEGKSLSDAADAAIPLAAANASSPGIADYSEAIAAELTEEYRRLNA